MLFASAGLFPVERKWRIKSPCNEGKKNILKITKFTEAIRGLTSRYNDLQSK